MVHPNKKANTGRASSGVNSNLTKGEMFGMKRKVSNYFVDDKPFPIDTDYQDVCKESYNGLGKVDFVDQCLINVGLARSYLNDFNRRKEEHRIMYPDIYKNEIDKNRDMKAVATVPRPLGRGGMTQRMLERIATRQEAGLSAEEILCDIMQDPKQSIELRFRAASKVADLVYPKAASVEIEVDDNRLSLEEIDKRLMSLLLKGEKVINPEVPVITLDIISDEKSKFLSSLKVDKVEALELFDNEDSDNAGCDTYPSHDPLHDPLYDPLYDPALDTSLSSVEIVSTFSVGSIPTLGGDASSTLGGDSMSTLGGDGDAINTEWGDY